MIPEKKIPFKWTYRIAGAFRNARASANRCFSPPLNCRRIIKPFYVWKKQDNNYGNCHFVKLNGYSFHQLTFPKTNKKKFHAELTEIKTNKTTHAKRSLLLLQVWGKIYHVHPLIYEWKNQGTEMYRPLSSLGIYPFLDRDRNFLNQ